MNNSPEGAVTSRRGFLGLVGLSAVAVAGGGLLTGCSTPAGPRPGSGGATAAALDKLTSLTPTHIPYAGVTADIVGQNGAPGGFTKYPATLVDAITAKPGKDGHYKAMTPLWGPLPPPLGKNSYFDAVNADLGATIEFNILDGMTIIEKMNAVIAGGDVVDITMIPSWTVNQIPQFGEAVDQLFEDLTPHLQGDAAKKYPLLANIATDAWEWGVFNGKLIGIPGSYTFPMGVILLYRKDMFDANGWTAPKTADEMLALGKEITDPKKKRWAFGDIKLMAYQLFRSPKEWVLSGGKLLHRYETPEFEASIAFMRKLYEDKLIHPDIVSSKGANAKELFKAGQIVITQDGFGGWKEMLEQMLPTKPDFWIEALPHFGHDGGAPGYHKSEEPGQYTFIKKGLGKEKTEEILSLLNYLAAPFGTQENMLSVYGVEGKHFTKNEVGAPKKTDLGLKEAPPTYFFLSGRPDAITESELPKYVETAATWYNEAANHWAPNPHEGIRIQRPAKYAALEQPTEDKIQDVVRGRRPLSELKQVVDEWRKDGGDESREFYMKVLQDNGRA
ncbi:extracellular solute-binding protein [Planobispora takensis]|uniref:Sugar ABC transporter substrate-binding protein n=1 Tax=Planobispora takensis TaxID=1367882 RepID=A0A8J3WY63_9ACTN|nr:extracellular solute-binding protein [Planobispora takensis]GII03517.1 sugar ABC transporter substrate-binding protein [Planobispora takensis]